MKQLAELVPIILFFIAYKMDGETLTLLGYSHTFDGIYSATAVLMISNLVHVLLTWLICRKVEKKLIWMLLAIVIFGGATLLLRNELFIQWKPTVFNWGLALVFIASMIFSEKNILERMLGGQIELPKAAWSKLNILWIANFIIVGALNIIVAYRFSEAFWVSYKLWSSIGFTVILMIITTIMIYPYLQEQSQQPKDNSDSTHS